jgi:hypothetical protein
VKVSAAEIVRNLRFPNGTPIIPAGSLVYLSTDDPEGRCKDCFAQRKPCTEFPSPKPQGCPEDVSSSCRRSLRCTVDRQTDAVDTCMHLCSDPQPRHPVDKQTARVCACLRGFQHVPACVMGIGWVYTHSIIALPVFLPPSLPLPPHLTLCAAVR